ncbi:hypothetical protein HAX54_012628 [Datura stramonium]|uniref:RNase H type-1 domain-containing protein n=1 Tax=Datura stramonium TaxID=4076 RepID=A0ABS8RYB4_DATST|nr:hypothetical protein [Datura stramonium]
MGLLEEIQALVSYLYALEMNVVIFYVLRVEGFLMAQLIRAEAAAIKKGLDYCIQNQLLTMILETDSLTLKYSNRMLGGFMEYCYRSSCHRGDEKGQGSPVMSCPKRREQSD